MDTTSADNRAFLSVLLSVIVRTSEETAICDNMLLDIGTIPISELHKCMDALMEKPKSLEQMSSLFSYEVWRIFYDYIKNIKLDVEMWPMPNFDVRLIYKFSRLVKLIYERTADADYAYLYACTLIDLAYEEIYQETFLEGIYSGVYKKASNAVEVLLSAWKRTPSIETFSRVLWGYEHKRECHGVEYTESIVPERHQTPWVDEEIRCFLKSDEVTEEYRLLPEAIRILQVIDCEK